MKPEVDVTSANPGRSEFGTALCPKCGADHSRVVMSGKDYLYLVPGDYFVSECGQCGFWFETPRPTLDQLVSFYPSDYVPHSKYEVKPFSRGNKSYLQRHLG